MWRLECDRGRQTWKYDADSKEKLPEFKFDQKKNKNSADLLYRTQALRKNYKEFSMPKDIQVPKDKFSATAFESLGKAINFYQALQYEDGHWPGDYGGPMFLMPGLIIMCHVTGIELPESHKKEMIKYLLNHQNGDGGWGLHIEDHSTMFGSVLNYVSLRLLGFGKDEVASLKARDFIRLHGGALKIPSWGKFWLCVLGVFEWDGVNTLLPEMWLLPYWLPMHPGRFWCHCRMVYLPMSYCYGHRVHGEITPLIRELRSEIHNTKYSEIQWSKMRSECADIDRYVSSNIVLRFVFGVTNLYEKFAIPFLRRRALKFIEEYVNAEDYQTKYVDIGPVNKVINALCVWHAQGPNSEAFKKHVDRLYDYLWVAEDGMKMQGYNGSQLWDTAFATQAIMESGWTEYFKETLLKAYHYFDITQVAEETPNRERFFRHISLGAWPFSTQDHGWPISDCTSEGLKATLILNRSGLVEDKTITDERLYNAINVILSYQNTDGGWATYENMRGSSLLEYINPSEVFGDIIVDYSYTECTSACIQSMVSFQLSYPDHRRDEIRRAIERGVNFLKKKQRPDGGWYGSWGVCFTYGTWFGMEGLIAGGEPVDSPALKKACDFLIKVQQDDGGWGESYLSCVSKQYVQNAESQVVNTGWALLSLMKAEYPDPEPIKRGIKYLLSKQKKDGDWDQQNISGVFNANCMITYTAYRNVFPIWAIGRYLNEYSKKFA